MEPVPYGPQPDDRTTITQEAFEALLTVHGPAYMRHHFKTFPDWWDFTREEFAALGMNYHSDAYWNRNQPITYTRVDPPAPEPTNVFLVECQLWGDMEWSADKVFRSKAGAVAYVDAQRKNPPEPSGRPYRITAMQLED